MDSLGFRNLGYGFRMFFEGQQLVCHLSLSDDLERIMLLVERLRFAKFDEADAWKPGPQIRDAALICFL